MDFTIITPVYNDPRVERTLKSVFDQKYDYPVEIIVVDGNSTDRTTEILQENQDRIDVLIQEPDEGVYDAMNKGIQQASGEVVGILNSDDWYQDEYVIRDVASELDKEGTDTCYGDLVYTNQDNSVVRYWESDECQKRKFYFGWMPPHPTFFVRKRLYEKYGKFDLDFPIAADYEFMLRLLLKHDVSTTHIDRIMVRMTTGGQSNESATNIIRANWEVRQSWKKNGLRGGTFVPILKPLRKIPQYAQRDKS